MPRPRPCGPHPVWPRRAASELVRYGAAVLLPAPALRAVRVLPLDGGLAVPVLRAAADLSWRARLQPLDAGWVALGQKVPLLDSGRATEVLGWHPTRTAQRVVEEVVDGMRSAAAGTSPLLRRRRVIGELRTLVRHGPVSHRHRS